jgi:hypothetical protein
MENIWLDLQGVYVNRNKYLIMFYDKYIEWVDGSEMTDTDDEFDDINGSVLKPLTFISRSERIGD